jgi:hypothetical protein
MADENALQRPCLPTCFHYSEQTMSNDALFDTEDRDTNLQLTAIYAQEIIKSDKQWRAGNFLVSWTPEDEGHMICRDLSILIKRLCDIKTIRSSSNQELRCARVSFHAQPLPALLLSAEATDLYKRQVKTTDHYLWVQLALDPVSKQQKYYATVQKIRPTFGLFMALQNLVSLNGSALAGMFHAEQCKKQPEKTHFVNFLRHYGLSEHEDQRETWQSVFDHDQGDAITKEVFEMITFPDKLFLPKSAKEADDEADDSKCEKDTIESSDLFVAQYIYVKKTKKTAVTTAIPLRLKVSSHWRRLGILCALVQSLVTNWHWPVGYLRTYVLAVLGLDYSRDGFDFPEIEETRKKFRPRIASLRPDDLDTIEDFLRGFVSSAGIVPEASNSSLNPGVPVMPAVCRFFSQCVRIPSFLCRVRLLEGLGALQPNFAQHITDMRQIFRQRHLTFAVGRCFPLCREMKRTGMEQMYTIYMLRREFAKRGYSREQFLLYLLTKMNEDANTSSLTETKLRKMRKK